MFSHIVCVSECLHAAPTTTTASAAATAAQEGKHTSPVHPPTPRRLAHLDFYSLADCSASDPTAAAAAAAQGGKLTAIPLDSQGYICWIACDFPLHINAEIMWNFPEK